MGGLKSDGFHFVLRKFIEYLSNSFLLQGNICKMLIIEILALPFLKD